jgi:hypothetical protein
MRSRASRWDGSLSRLDTLAPPELDWIVRRAIDRVDRKFNPFAHGG